MKELTQNIWDLVKEQCDKVSKYDSNIVFAQERFNDFHELFKVKYEELKNKYMLDSVKYLDRHKSAALSIICLLESNIVTYKSNETHNNSFNDVDGSIEESIFIGAELFALKAALSYMLEKLNEKLYDKNIDKKIDTFLFPEALSCETQYIEILCRNLYYAKKDFVLNPLDLSEKLFLLEYICLLKSGINPDLLKNQTK